MAVEQINPAEPHRSAEMDVKDTTNTTQLSREGSNEPSSTGEAPLVRRNWYQQLWDSLKTPGSAMQIITAALLAIAIGLAVSTTVTDIPEAVPVILEIPGSLWLRALRATVLPLIVVAMILAVQNLMSMDKGGGKLARFTILWYVGTTTLAIIISTILVDLVWRPLMTVADGATLQMTEEEEEDVAERGGMAAHDVVVQVFESFIPNNVAAALANDELLAVLVSAIVVGCLIKGPDSSLLRAVKEIEKIVMKIITFLIKLAPIGVFFLILSNLFTLNIEDIGQNLGVLVGGSIVNMAIHLFIVLPILYFILTRENFYTFWIKCSRSWITAWATASSAATMPVTLSVAAERGVPNTVAQFTIPLGTLVNMDGTAIYFPTVVVFLAATQGMPLNAGDYAIIVLLATLSSIATTPIPSSSLVLTLIIAESVGIPITGMYAVVVAIDWFIDRFRTMVNVSGDLIASKIMAKLTGITDDDVTNFAPGESVQRVMSEAGAAQHRQQSKEMV
ncbi:hypothetical protein Q7P35_002522 [Cladosporium inversicolor]